MSIKSYRLRLFIASISFFSLLVSLYSLTFRNPKSASALSAHVVISEVQVLGSTANDEFVELYNPTDIAVDLTGWRLNKRNSAGTAQNLVASMAGSIPAHGFYLVANPSYDGTTTPDATYSATTSTITTNNTVYLFSDAGVTLVDKVGFGTSFESETQPFPDTPVTNGSIERKPGEGSPTSGNGEDSNNNANDFSSRTVSDPQNSFSQAETPELSTNSPTPTILITVSPAPSPIPTITQIPTLAPTLTVTPEPSLSPIVTESPSLTPTQVLTVTPTKTPKKEYKDYRHKFTSHFYSIRKDIENKCRKVVNKFEKQFHSFSDRFKYDRH